MKAWKKWLSFSKRVAVFQSKLILSLFYFTLVAPFALAVKVFSDPLGIKNPKWVKSYWIPKKQDNDKQFGSQF